MRIKTILVILLMLTAYVFGAGEFEDMISDKEENLQKGIGGVIKWLSALLYPTITLTVPIYAFSHFSKQAKQDQESNTMPLIYSGLIMLAVGTILYWIYQYIGSAMMGDEKFLIKTMQDFWVSAIK